MTFSIVAIDPATGDVGVAVASKFLAVGNIVPWVEAGKGAVATQALCNASFGPDGLALLGTTPASDVLATLLARDPGAERRQVGMVDALGGSASHTGSSCLPWAGQRTGVGYACQGNCLAGPGVIDSMVTAFESTEGLFALRVFAALEAGDRAGGDERGRQSAAIKVLRKGAGYQGLSDTVMDLRVADHPEPMAELRRLIGLHDLYFPSGPSETVLLDGAVLEEMKVLLARAGRAVPEGSGWSTALSDAIDDFTGSENVEERVHLGERTIDVIALDHLRTLYPGSGS